MRIGPTVVEDIFSRAGAFLEGHFILASGKHSPRYLEKFQVLQWPQETERLCAAIVESARGLAVQTVAGPTTGGIILAHEVARQLGVRAVYAERRDDGGREFRRGFTMNPGERVLVVDDIMSTGGSVQETIDAVTATGAEVVGIGVLADRSAGRATFAVPLISLWEVSIPVYTPEECPQCVAGVPLRKPGTTPVLAAAP
ncbi:MAG TPA: orotate phosphoribosyltransferase [Candidatus Saccharimonadales bacterium]|nr:orotate phosphoribosyltransferase [Candidatus Saccharimonadales bacterium]